MSNWLFPDRAESAQADSAGETSSDSPDAEPGDVDPDDADVDPLDASAVAPGTNVLVVGPPMTGKRRLLFDLVGGSDSHTGAFVTTKKPADKMAAWFAASRPDDEEWDLSFVDATGSGDRIRPSRVDDLADLRVVSSPGDLTGVGIELSGILRRWHHADAADPRVGLHSLSTHLMYADVRRVYQFLHVVTTRIATVDGVGVFTLDVTGGTEADDTLRQVFDARVEVRDRPEGPQFRVRGAAFGPRDWTEF